MASSDSLPSTSSRSSRSSTNSSNLHVDMPSPTRSGPTDARPDPHTGRHPPRIPHPHIHIATPHPLATTAQFLDRHVPGFARHHAEYIVNKDFRAAKREARRGGSESPIPEMEDDDRKPGVASPVQDKHDPDPRDFKYDEELKQAWAAVLAKREAARRRSGSLSLSPSSPSDSNHTLPPPSSLPSANAYVGGAGPGTPVAATGNE